MEGAVKFRRCITALVLTAALCSSHLELLAFAPGQSDSDVADLKIVILEGEDSVNIVKQKTAVQPVVEVRDKNNLPVSGAAVLFALPASGPSGVFANGATTITVVTDSAGRATVTGLQPVGTGSFNISVTAHAAGHSGSISIKQTNIAEAAVGAAAAAAGLAASQAAIIGVVSTLGSLTLGKDSVTGTANLIEGASLKTTSSTGDLFLTNGSTVGVGINSSVNIYQNRVVLHSGVIRVDSPSASFPVEAMGYRIEGASGAHLAIRLAGKQLQASSIIGEFTVFNSKGTLLQTVPSGGNTVAGSSAAGTIPTSGAGAAGSISNATTLLILGGLVAAGVGIGAYYGSQGGGTPTPISPL